MAENGQEALTAYHSSDYDIILMDMEMPIMDGYAATRAIRAEEAALGRKAVPIIAITAHALAEFRDKSIEAGCTDFLSKPLGHEQLINMLYKYAPETLSSSQATTDLDQEAPCADAPSPDVVLIDKIMEEIVPGYLATLAQDIDIMRAALASDDYEPIRRMGHNSKGTGISYGLPRISQLGAILELAAQVRNPQRIEETLCAMSEYLSSVTSLLDMMRHDVGMILGV